MSEYKLTPEFKRVLRKNIILSRLPILALALAVGVGLSVFQLKSAEGLIILVPVVVMAGSWGVFIGYRRQIRQAESFEISLTKDQITREMLGVPPLTLHRDDIRRIERHFSGYI